MYRPKAVLFDMDGVILDTEPVSRDGWRAGAAAQGYVLTDEIYNSLVGTNIEGSRERLLSAFGGGFDYETAKRIRNEYVRSHRGKHGVALKKGILNLLDRLDALNIPCCVATSTNRDRAFKYLSDAGLAERFKAIVGGDCVTRGKPDPEIYLKAASVMGVPPEDCCAVEDSVNGVTSAYLAGAKVILVPDLQPPDETTLKRAYAVFADLDEAVGLLPVNTRVR